MKNRLITFTIALLLTTIFCNAQKQKIENTMEKYDFKLIEQSNVNPLAVESNGCIKLMYKMTESGAFYNEYPSNQKFYKIQKKFYLNGTLKSIKILPYGEQIYYDEEGQLVKKYNTEDLFGRIKYDSILKFLDHEKVINLKTGEGGEYPVIDNKTGYTTLSRFEIYPPENNQKYLVIIIMAAPWNKSIETIYHLDKDTGEVLFKESKEVYPII